MSDFASVDLPVLVAALLALVACGTVGNWLVLRKEAMTGDAIALATKTGGRNVCEVVVDDERRGTVVAGNVGNEPPVLGNRGMIGVAGTVVPGMSPLWILGMWLLFATTFKTAPLPKLHGVSW